MLIIKCNYYSLYYNSTKWSGTHFFTTICYKDSTWRMNFIFKNLCCSISYFLSLPCTCPCSSSNTCLYPYPNTLPNHSCNIVIFLHIIVQNEPLGSQVQSSTAMNTVSEPFIDTCQATHMLSASPASNISTLLPAFLCYKDIWQTWPTVALSSRGLSGSWTVTTPILL